MPTGSVSAGMVIDRSLILVNESSSLTISKNKVFVSDVTSRSVEIFDLETLTWADGPPLPRLLRLAAAVVYNDNLIIFGGDTGGYAASR